MFFDMLNGMYMLFILHLTQSNTYPKPLSAEEEKHYLERVATGDIEARNILVEHNLRLVAHIVKKYHSNNNNYDDLISVGIIGLIKAINTFDSTKAQRLSCYASTCIQNEILMLFRNNKRTQQEISLNESVDSDKDGNNLVLMDVIAINEDIVDQLDIKIKSEKLASYINEVLDEREKLVIALRYGLDGNEEKPQREIAKMLNISRSYISRIETKALKKLRKRFEKG